MKYFDKLILYLNWKWNQTYDTMSLLHLYMTSLLLISTRNRYHVHFIDFNFMLVLDQSSH